jgi:hypothetical protein
MGSLLVGVGAAFGPGADAVTKDLGSASPSPNYELVIAVGTKVSGLVEHQWTAAPNHGEEGVKQTAT